ncbi:MAG: DUF1292 domain-containing protein [Planctomycetaceae bacterium]|nr:DUF1292 domain-containing protein [Planctomycetaceae bacterium]
MSHDEHEHCECGCGCEHEEPIYIDTITETGEELTFELLEIFEFEGKLYAHLAPCDDDAEDDAAFVMECEVAEDEYTFHEIEDDALFERILAHIGAQLVEDEDEENSEKDGGCGCGGCGCGRK